MKISRSFGFFYHVVSCSLFSRGSTDNSEGIVESTESSVQKGSSLLVDSGQSTDNLGGSGSVSLDGNIGGSKSGLAELILQDATVGVVVGFVANSKVIYSSELLSRFASCFFTGQSNAAWVSEALG